MLPSFDWMLEIPPNLQLMSIPDWLDDVFLTKVLISNRKDSSIVVKKFNIKALSNPGEQFTTSIFRIQVIYTGLDGQISKHLFVKTTPMESANVTSSINIFSNEIKMYSEVIPEMVRLFKNVFNDEKDFAPRLIYHELCETPVLVFEDLTALGYTMQTQQMDLERTKAILSRLARFHSCSVHIEERSPVCLSSAYKRAPFQIRPDMIEHIKVDLSWLDITWKSSEMLQGNWAYNTAVN